MYKEQCTRGSVKDESRFPRRYQKFPALSAALCPAGQEGGGMIYLALTEKPVGTRLVWFGWTYYGIHQVFAVL